MSALRVRQIQAKLRNTFEKHLDLSDLSPNDAERNGKILARCLVAFAVQQQTACSDADAGAAVWDGADDNGIDAAYFDATSCRIILVQGKWIVNGVGEPESRDVGQFADGVRDLVEQETANFAGRLQRKVADIGQHINIAGNKIHMVLVTTGKSTISRHAQAKLDRVIKELNGVDIADPVATKEVLGLREVYAGLADPLSAEKVSLDANILDWSKITQPYAAYFGVIDGLQIKDWWTSHEKRLVRRNIRHALGATDINTQIRNTVSKNPEHFWYFNNGITLVTDEVVTAPRSVASKSSGIFKFKGASIVNGAQTVSTLGKMDNDANLGRVRVPIRVIILKDTPEDFGEQVTKTNNLQNRVEARDFVAQDREQARLQQEMAIEGIEYQFLRSGDFVISEGSCELIELTTALACASGDSGLAVQIKTGTARFFTDLSKPPYRTLFNPSLSGARAFNTVVLQREIDRWIDEKKKSIAKKSGFGWGSLIHGNRILSAAVFARIGKDKLDRPISEFRANLSKLKVKENCEETYKRMVEVLGAKYENRFLAVLFKSPSAGKVVFDFCRATRTKPR